jgi:UDP-N-acetylmuramate dehydrogenase
MQIIEKIKLAPYTTFKIGGEAKYFCEVKDQFDALRAFEFAKEKNLPVFILGGGSNVLISDSGFNGLVIRVANSGIEVIGSSDALTIPSAAEGSLKHDDKIKKRDSSQSLGMEKNSVLLKVASGENWDSVVAFAVKNNWWGIENLSHIPGSTGAIAVQNVGAYGQEAKNVIESVTVFDTKTHEITNLKNEACGFDYRSSIFNTTQKGRYIIFYITFKLYKNPNPILNYRDLAIRFSGTPNPSLLSIRRSVIDIRDGKFPFPTEAVLGNAGSFFKNYVTNENGYAELAEKVKELWGHAEFNGLDSRKFVEDKNIKIPTAFLFELCGIKDLEFGGAAINKNQPLVIINKNGLATAKDVLNLAKMVKKTIYDKLQINIHIEPELVGFFESDLKELV